MAPEIDLFMRASSRRRCPKRRIFRLEGYCGQHNLTLSRIVFWWLFLGSDRPLVDPNSRNKQRVAKAAELLSRSRITNFFRECVAAGFNLRLKHSLRFAGSRRGGLGRVFRLSSSVIGNYCSSRGRQRTSARRDPYALACPPEMSDDVVADRGPPLFRRITRRGNRASLFCCRRGSDLMLQYGPPLGKTTFVPAGRSRCGEPAQVPALSGLA